MTALLRVKKNMTSFSYTEGGTENSPPAPAYTGTCVQALALELTAYTRVSSGAQSHFTPN